MNHWWVVVDVDREDGKHVRWRRIVEAETKEQAIKAIMADARRCGEATSVACHWASDQTWADHIGEQLVLPGTYHD